LIAFALVFPTFISSCGFGGVLKRRCAILVVVSSSFGVFDMTDDQFQIKSFALVGTFLQKWAHMEQHMHLAIAAATKLSPLMNTIICSNLTLREKLNILRTTVDTSDIEPEERKALFKSTLRDIGEFSMVRNTLAHDLFYTGKNNVGIAFMPIKAKGNFDSSIVQWTVTDFRNHFAKIDAFAIQMQQLIVALEHASFNAEKLYLPMQIVGSSARGGHPSLQPQEPTGSDPATPKKGDETTPETPKE
jgi:hypothetical protein